MQARTRTTDPIDHLAGNRPGIRPVDLLQGEDRTVGRTYDDARWFGMHDTRKVAMLRDLAERYGGDPQMRWFTAGVLERSGCAPRDFPAQAACIHAFVQGSCYYTNEPGEQLQSPWRTLKVRTGDCDDLALLIATMAESVALPWRFALAGKMRDGRMVRWIEGERWPTGAEMFHIYIYLGWPPFQPKTWAAAEPTIRGIPLGYDVVDRGLPGQAQHSVDLGGGGQRGHAGYYGQDTVLNAGATPANLVTDLAVGAPASAPPTITAIPDGDLPLPARALSFATDKAATLWSYIDWKDLTNALIQGVIVAIAVPVAIRILRPR